LTGPEGTNARTASGQGADQTQPIITLNGVRRRSSASVDQAHPGSGGTLVKRRRIFALVSITDTFDHTIREISLAGFE
jgi:hypothetical protein